MSTPDLFCLVFIAFMLLFDSLVLWPTFVRRSQVDLPGERRWLWSSWIIRGYLIWAFEPVLGLWGAAFLSLEHFEMPYIIMVMAVQLHAITRAVTSKLRPSPSGLPPLTLPYPYPATQHPVAVSS